MAEKSKNQFANKMFGFVKPGKTGNNGDDLHLTSTLVPPRALENT